MLLSFLALAAPPSFDNRVWVELGAAGAVGPEEATSLGAGGQLGFGVALGADPHRVFGLQVGLRELVVTNETRDVGLVQAGFRYPAGSGFHTGLGYVHGFEVPGRLGLFAAGEDVEHRNGLMVTGGYESGGFGTRPTGFGARVHPFIQLDATVMPSSEGPPVYVLLSLGLRLGLIRPV
jgi:hypothetical protein